MIETSLRTLGMFGFVGDPLPYYGIPDRPFLDPISLLLLVGGLLIALWRWRDPRYAFVFIWFFISLAPGMLSQPAPNSTRTLGVQTVLFTLIGIAVAAIIRRYPQKIVVAAFAVLFAFNLIWTTHDYFTVWPSLPDTRFWHQSGLKAVADEVQRRCGYFTGGGLSARSFDRRTRAVVVSGVAACALFAQSTGCDAALLQLCGLR